MNDWMIFVAVGAIVTVAVLAYHIRGLRARSRALERDRDELRVDWP